MSKRPSFSLVFLSGGQGTRMQSSIPKQYLSIRNQPLMCYSFQTLVELPGLQEIVVVCEPPYRGLFESIAKEKGKTLFFALPGERRQDSVFNGIQLLENNPLVCIHDAARPLIQSIHVLQALEVAEEWGAAALGVKSQSTIKICKKDQTVQETLDRTVVWEIQTPQVIRLELLKEGFAHANQKGSTVTDDVSLVEQLGYPVKIVEGAYSNIKATTPGDLILIEQLMEKNVLL